MGQWSLSLGDVGMDQSMRGASAVEHNVISIAHSELYPILVGAPFFRIHKFSSLTFFLTLCLYYLYFCLQLVI